MMQRGPRARTRAGFVVVLASVWALASIMWMPPELVTEGGGTSMVQSLPLLVAVYGAGGVLGLGGLGVAQRWPGPGRLMVGAGGLVLLIGFLAFRDYSPAAVLSVGLSAVALLVAAPFVGDVPRSVPGN